MIRKHDDLYVLADVIYEHINYVGKHESIAQFEGMKERCIIVNGVSKAYAMTGWRIGFVAAPLELAKAVSKLQGQYTSGPGSISQKASVAAFNGPQEPVEEMRKAFERRKQLIVELAREIPGFEVNDPEAPSISSPSALITSESPTAKAPSTPLPTLPSIAQGAHVACVGGDSFGSPECFRMSYATSDENIVEAMRRIKAACERLK